MLFHEARRKARTDADGSLVLLDDQDRSLWDGAMIHEAAVVLEGAALRRQSGPYQLQAAIAGTHAIAATAGDTEWPQIASFYDRLLQFVPTSVVALNRAVAHAMAAGPEVGLAMIDGIEGLEDYHLYHSARADLLRRLGRRSEAAGAYRSALQLTTNATERRFLEGRLAGLGTG
jgi:RNA polymerase sigma-70 factor (ECF subfamily)